MDASLCWWMMTEDPGCVVDRRGLGLKVRNGGRGGLGSTRVCRFWKPSGV